MGDINIVGEIFGFIAVILGFIAFQMNSTKRLLMLQITICLCFSMQYLLLGAYPAMAMNIIGIIRNIVYTNKRIFSSKWIPYLFAIIMGIFGVISWTGWYSVFVIIGLMINTVGLSFKNPQNIRISMLIAYPLCTIYDSFEFAIAAIVYDLAVMFSSFIGILRAKKVKI